MKAMQTSGQKLLGWEKILQWCILVAVFIFCFSDLSLKPPHVDESVNGFFVNTLWEHGFYPYDPNNYHGPLLFYLFQISEKIFGFGILSFRIVSALFLLLTIVVTFRSRAVLGSYASLFIAIALGLSPGMVFFSRSAIHEPAFGFLSDRLDDRISEIKGAHEQTGTPLVFYRGFWMHSAQGERSSYWVSHFSWHGCG